MSLDLQVKPKIHNRFDVYKKNVVSGKEEQVAYAENIILDNMWTRLCAGSTYFVSINYGTGSGTLSKTRTDLFTHEGSKTPTDVEKNYGNPTSYYRRKITIDLTESNNKTLTEVGISFGSGQGNLVTHALLRDMNGNPISILKTSVDILTIYATVYFTLDNSHPTLKMLAAANNQLIAYLMGGGFPGVSNNMTLGSCGAVNSTPTGLMSLSLGYNNSSPIGSWTSDVANKRRSLSATRFGVNDANGHVQEINICGIARLALPASGIFEGLDIVGASIGTGDGATTEFFLPSRNIRQSSIVIKKDGVVESGLTKSLVTKSTYRLSAELPGITAAALNLEISYDGMACVVSNGTSPYVYVYDFDEDTDVWTRRPNLPTLPSGNCYASISGDGNVVAVAYPASPYLMVFDWNGASWTKRPDPSVLPAGNGSFSSLNQDGSVVAIAHQLVSPYITVYDWVGGAFVKRANPGTLPDQYTNKIHLTPDGNFLACMSIHSNSVRWDMQAWSGSAWTKRNGESLSYPAEIRMSSDASVVLFTRSDPSSGGPKLYRWNGSAYAVSYTFDNAYASYGEGAAWISKDGQYLFLPYRNGAPYFYLFKYDGVNWNRLDGYAPPAISSTASRMAMSDDLRICLYTTGGAPIYTMVGTPKNTKIVFDSAPANGVAITADYTVDGIHKTTTRVIDVTFTIQFGEPA